MNRVLLVIAGVAAVAGCDGRAGADDSPSVRTVVLEGPPGGEAVYEPHVAVGADGRVLVAAQYGVGYNRGGLRFWTGRSGPDGNGWDEGEAVPQPMTTGPTMAADATVAIGPDGTQYLLGLSADSTRGGVPDASLVLATAPPGGGPFTHRLSLARVDEPSPAVLTATDKPWMVLDPDTSDGPAGTLYMGWTALTVHLDRDPIEIERTLMVAT